MRKFLIFILPMLFASFSYADNDRAIVMFEDESLEELRDYILPSPQVTFNDEYVNISCDSVLVGDIITIKAFDGTVLYHAEHTISPVPTSLPVPERPLPQTRFLIEIEGRDHFFYGYF